MISPLSRFSVGVLQVGMRVIVGGEAGTVQSVHEPSWLDHKTRSLKRELQSADIIFDSQRPYPSGAVPSVCISYEEIQIIDEVES